QGYNGRIVGVGVVQLTATGIFGSSSVVVEAVLKVPKLRYAIASSGPVLSSGGLTVTSVDTYADYGDPTKVRPGSMTSNTDSATEVSLDPQTDVSGDVQACGGVHLDPGGGTMIGGEVRQYY